MISFQKVQHLSIFDAAVHYLPNVFASIAVSLFTGAIVHATYIDDR
jgi:hypothetical protein